MPNSIRREEPPYNSASARRVHTYIAAIYADLGESDEAFAWLERGYRERDPGMLYLNVSPLFDPIRTDPRFDDLLRRIGFPESAIEGPKE